MVAAGGVAIAGGLDLSYGPAGMLLRQLQQAKQIY
jgi:hypothetical protein